MNKIVTEKYCKCSNKTEIGEIGEPEHQADQHQEWLYQKKLYQCKDCKTIVIK